MKHFRFAGVGVALLAVLAFSAMAVASSASAAVTFLLALWLEGGANVVETMLVEGTGEGILGNLNAPIIKTTASVLCSGIGVGTVGPNSAGDITEGLTLGGVAISMVPLTGTGLSCTLVAVCESSKIWAVNLPWLAELELWEEGALSGFVGLIGPHTGGGNPGFYIECTILGVKTSEECSTAQSAVEIINVATGVEVVDSESFTLLMGDKNGLCTGNNEETAFLESNTGGDEKDIIVNSLVGVLSASS